MIDFNPAGNHRVVINVYDNVPFGPPVYTQAWLLQTVPRIEEQILLRSTNPDQLIHDCVRVKAVVHHLVETEEEVSIEVHINCVKE